MTDDIVQTIKIDVEGDDKAQQSIEKIGESANTSFEQLKKAADTAKVSIEDFGRMSERTQQQYIELSQRVQQGSQQIVESTREVQQAAGEAGSGTKDLGGGLDQVSQKSGVSTREMRALGKVMKEFGAGELAGQAFGFYKIATSLGALGIAAFALAKAFSSLKSAMKEADETAKSLKSLENIGAGSAESLKAFSIALTAAGGKMKDFEKGWTDLTAKVEEYKAKQADADGSMAKWVNNADDYANSLRNIANGHKETLSPLATAETRHNALLKVIDQEAGGWKVLADGTRVWGIDAEKATIFLAKLREGMDEVGKSKLDKDLKALGIDLELVAKGSDKLAEALDKAKKKAADPGFIQQQAALKVFEDALVESQKTVEEWGQTLKIKFTEAVLGWKKIFAGGFGFFGEVLAEAGAQIMGGLKSIGSSIAKAVTEWVTTKVDNAWQWITEKFNDVVGWLGSKIEQAKQFVSDWVTTPVANAWGWVKETWEGIVSWFSTKIDEAKQLITDWVTTPVADAWQWIKDAFQAALDWMAEKWAAFKSSLGFGGGTAAAPSGGGGFASGGEVHGRSGIDSNLAWLTSGEFVMNTSAVQKYGTAMMHAINSLQAPRFAMGGLNIARPSLGSVSAFGGGLHNVTINFPGLPEIIGLRAPSGVVDQLRNAAAMAQVRSGGRKPSRYS